MTANFSWHKTHLRTTLHLFTCVIASEHLSGAEDNAGLTSRVQRVVLIARLL